MLTDVVRLNIARYRTNPVIIVPPLVAMAFELAIPLLTGIPSTDFPDLKPGSYALMGFGTLALSLTISFLSLIGQASMASEVVLEGKASLRDWVHGVRKYSTRVLGVYAIYLGIMIVSVIPLAIIFWYAMLPQLLHQMGTSWPEISSSTPLIPASTSIAINWTAITLTSVITAVLYMWLASMIFEDTEVFTSISAGNQAVRVSGRTFLGFTALFILASGIANLVENLPMYLGTYTQQPYGGYLTPTHVTSLLVNAIFSPLWFLIALTLYRGRPQ
jgi:hypothetical protein